MKYQGNVLMVWFASEEIAAVRAVPLAEFPVSKDRWIAADAEVLTFPSMPNEFVEQAAQLLFNGVDQGVRTEN
jgi:hypothetical protein